MGLYFSGKGIFTLNKATVVFALPQYPKFLYGNSEKHGDEVGIERTNFNRGEMLTLPIKFSKFFSFSCLKVKSVNVLPLMIIRPSARADKDGTVISYAIPTIRYTTNHTG